MKRAWIKILGILNIIVGGSLVLYYCVWLLESVSDAFTWGLPILMAAILALICGIFSLKRGRGEWAVAGLVVAGAVGIYLLILAWFVSWAMA